MIEQQTRGLCKTQSFFCVLTGLGEVIRRAKIIVFLTSILINTPAFSVSSAQMVRVFFVQTNVLSFF